MLLILLIFTISITPSMTLFDFKSQTDIQKWNVVNDGVMGGLSKGTIALNENGHALFTGNVLLENNGGFSSVRHRFKRTNINVYQKIVLRVKGDGKNYQFRVKTNASDFYSYTYTFKTKGEWETIEIPFSEMAPSFRGRKVNLPNYPGEEIEEMAFLIGNGKRETFALEIDKIEVH
ncbi:CIA30 family protein [uncultured Planktosalinus sp.]|uniref:CIA30 family protein n=1 Tax=uncultured Planktosalinus sp. TaxID=1810935 RepID=UPI0030D82C2C